MSPYSKFAQYYAAKLENFKKEVGSDEAIFTFQGHAVSRYA
jgi:hypothetical protein